MPWETEEVPFLYLPKEKQLKNEQIAEDDWDDTLLVRAYDKAILKAKREIVSKLQKELGLTTEEVDMLCPEKSAADKQENKKKARKDGRQTSKKGKWSVGSKCRAIYSEDGLEYEAEVIEVNSKKSCRVRYYGYENEEDVYFRNLLPSRGKEAIKQQIEQAAQDEEGEYNESEGDSNHEEGEFSGSEENNLQLPRRTPLLNRRHNITHPMPTTGLLNPPPCFAGAPIPPLVGMDEAQKSLLISWYMCGYYTGYYQRKLHLD